MTRTTVGLVAIAVTAAACVSAPEATPSATAALATAAQSAAAPPARAERVFTVAPDGDDTNAGTEGKPFRTLAAAQSAVREVLARSRSTSILVSIRAGTYRLSAPLTFDARDSPADGSTVTYAGPIDAGAVLVGGQPVTGWETVSSGTYRAKVDRKFWTLYENGERAILARTPNSGYLAVAAEVGTGGSTTQLVYAPGDIPEGLDPGSASVYIWSGSSGTPPRLTNRDWEVDVLPVRAIDPATRTITLVTPALYPIRAGNRYFLQGPRPLLDRPGEFAVEGGFLYYRPRAEPIERQEVVAPTVARIIEVKGTASALARNLVFEHLTLTGSDFAAQATDSAAVHIENAENVAVRSSKIRMVGGSGVVLRGHAQRIAVTGDLIEDVGVHGVLVQGPAVGAPHTSTTNTISGDLIRRGGRLHGSGSGIKLQNSGENVIANCQISDMPRYGISLKGQTSYVMAPSYNGVAVTYENHWDFLHTRGNTIRGNDISNVLTDSQDAGGIELWGAGKGNVIENDRIHDFRAGIASGEAMGIYLDDESDHNIVRNNIVFGITGANATAAFIKGVYNEVTNNIFVNSGGGASFGSFKLFAQAHHDHLTIDRNVFYSTTGSDIYWFRDWSDDRLTEARGNLFFHTGGAYTVRFRFASERITLDDWRTRYGHDRDSVVADPLFVDAGAGNYSLRPGSPALALGFVNIDRTRIGLPADFAFGR